MEIKIDRERIKNKLVITTVKHDKDDARRRSWVGRWRDG
jgi:hypothetical protein